MIYALRYFFIISYNGANYHGWQIQQNATSVQEVIQEKLGLLLKVNIDITGSGRTDTGVHALQQYFHADIEKEIDCEDFKYHLNAVLPHDIAVHDIRPVSENAHARFDAISRSYIYKLILNKDPFHLGLAYNYHRELDLEKLDQASKILIGKHDFEAFSKVKTQVNNFYCEVMNAFWQQDGNEFSFHIEANRFLRGMVRAIVGTLLMVNEGKIKKEYLHEILASRDRSKAGRSVKPEGLYLSEIKYPNHIFKDR